MRRPPALLYIRISPNHSDKPGLWLPLFLLWPFGAALFLILLPFLIIGEFVLRLTPLELSPFRFLSTLYEILASVRGTIITVQNSRKGHHIQIKIV